MAHVSIILPALNEEAAIGAVLNALHAVPVDMEIIVVDDGSTDRTGDIARSKGAIVIRHQLALGAGQSVKHGIERATSDRIVMLDADCTYPTERIPDFLATLDGGFDLVVGARHGKIYRGSILKKIARFVFRMISEFATGKRIPDINSGMRAFHKSQIVEYFPHLCNGFSLPTTMTLAYFFTGQKVAYLPIEYRKRVGTTKVRIIRDSLRTLQYITESIVFFNPLKLFLLIAILGLCMAAIAGWWTLSIAVFFIGFFFSLLIFALGLMAQSLQRRR
jgi:glycosyltransferase involved in cell wall biosynthesis